MLVIGVAAWLTNARVQIGVRQVQHQVATDLDQTPPFAQRGLPVGDMLQQVRREDRIGAGIGEDAEAGGVFDNDIRTHGDSEQVGILAAVDADQVRPDLGRSATDVKPALRQVGQHFIAHLCGFKTLRTVWRPDHCFLHAPLPVGQQRFALRCRQACDLAAVGGGEGRHPVGPFSLPASPRSWRSTLAGGNRSRRTG